MGQCPVSEFGRLKAVLLLAGLIRYLTFCFEGENNFAKRAGNLTTATSCQL